MPFPGTSIPPAQWDSDTIDVMKRLLAGMYHANEAPGDPYRFTHATGKSTWSFGQAQWDVGQMLARDRPGTLSFFQGLGFNATQVLQLGQDPTVPPLTQAGADQLSQKLQTRQAMTAINNMFAGKLNDDVGLMNSVYTTLVAAGPGSIGQQVAQYIVSHPVLFVMVADYNNQYGLTLDPNNPNAKLMQFLSGRQVTLSDPSNLHSVTVSLSQINGGNFDLGSFIWFAMNTWQARMPPDPGQTVPPGVIQANRLLGDLDQFPGLITAQQRADLQTQLRAMGSLGPDDSRLPFMQQIEKDVAGRNSYLISSDEIRAQFGDWLQANQVTGSLPWQPWSGQIDSTQPDAAGNYWTASISVVAGRPVPPGGYSAYEYYIGLSLYENGNTSNPVRDINFWLDSNGRFNTDSVSGSHGWPVGVDTNAGDVDNDPSLTPEQRVAAHAIAAEAALAPQIQWGVAQDAAATGQPDSPVTLDHSDADLTSQIPSYAPTTYTPWPDGSASVPTDLSAAIQDSRWAGLAPILAQQIATSLNLGTPNSGGSPTLLINPETGSGPPTIAGVPFLDTQWVAPGDGILVSDPSTLRTQTADAPGETVVAFAPNVTLDGTPGNDELWAGAGADILLGGPNDTLHGGSGADTFVLGPNDVVYGGPGANVYQISPGIGAATIYGGAGKGDPVQFGAGITPQDVHVKPRGWTDDLTLEIPKTGDQIVLKDWYQTFAGEGPQGADDPYLEHPDWGTRIAQVVFADGTVWDATTLRAMSLVAGAPGETVVGFDTNDTLDGTAGGGELWAGSGNDTLLGGPGDFLHGGTGNDTFVLGPTNVAYADSGTNAFQFSGGDGQATIYAQNGGTDTVQLGPGITPASVQVLPRGWTDDLTLQIGSNGDAITLKDWYETDAAQGQQAADPFLEHPERGTRVQQVVFADGTVWDATTLRTMSLVAGSPGQTVVGFDTNDTLDGTAGNDQLWAGAGTDTLLGGPGDKLHGGTGADLFVSGSNNMLYDGGGVNTFAFAPGDGQDVVVANGGTDTVQFAAGIRPQDVIATRDNNNNLLLSVAGTTDQVLVADYFDPSTSSHQIQQVTFADGTVWNQTAIAQQVQLHTPPSLVGSSGGGYGDGYNSFGVQVTVPQGTRPGDQLIDFVEFSHPVTFTPGAGFAVLGNVNNKLYAFSKLATSSDSPGATETFSTWLNPGDTYGAVAVDYRGADSPTVQATQTGGPLGMTVGLATAGNPALVNELQAYGTDTYSPYTATLPSGDTLVAEAHATNVTGSVGGDATVATVNTGPANSPPPALDGHASTGYGDPNWDFGVQVVVPQSTQPGDLLVDFVEFSQAYSGYVPGKGWSVLGNVNNKLYALYKTATSADTPGAAETFANGLWAGTSYASVVADDQGGQLPVIESTQTSGPLAMTVAVPGASTSGGSDVLTAYGTEATASYTMTLPLNQTLVAEQHAGNIPSTSRAADLTLGRQTVAGTNSTVDVWAGTPTLDVTFAQSNGSQGDTLQIFQHGSATPMTVTPWDNADGSPGPQGTIETSDGSTLAHAGVASLIQAMAAYSAQSGLTWDQAIDQKPADVQAVLAQYWQPPH